MSAISETYNRGQNVLELADILPNVMFLSQQVNWSVIIANKNGKYELTYVLPNDIKILI